MGKRAPEAVESYESDGGFVEDAPRSKKQKSTMAKPKSEATMGKKAGSQSNARQSAGGDAFWEISKTRRLAVSEFKGNTMIDIREYYEKDGEMLPGKKGISLTLNQFNSVMENLPKIHKALKTKGINVTRPVFGNQAAGEADQSSDLDDSEDAESPEAHEAGEEEEGEEE